MSNRIELEKGYYLDDKYKEILNKLKEEKFEFSNELVEEDTYFTDINLNFIENKTCLRIRKTNNTNVELTYKPKTTKHTENYGKKETNVNISRGDYEDIKYILKELGYVEYVSFKKHREIYSKSKNDFEYNIMIDHIENIGDFIEIEILAQNYDDKEKVQIELENLIKKIECQNLKTKEKPYRDLVKESKNKRKNDR